MYDTAECLKSGTVLIQGIQYILFLVSSTLSHICDSLFPHEHDMRYYDLHGLGPRKVTAPGVSSRERPLNLFRIFHSV